MIATTRPLHSTAGGPSSAQASATVGTAPSTSCHGISSRAVACQWCPRMWTVVAAIATAPASSMPRPRMIRESDQSSAHGSRSKTSPRHPATTPPTRLGVSFSCRKTAAIGRVQRLAVYATTEARPGGTKRSALKTSALTRPTRTSPTDRRTGTSLRLSLESRPLRPTIVKTIAAAPTSRKAASHIAAIAWSPRAMMGQLTPKIRTVTAPTR